MNLLFSFIAQTELIIILIIVPLYVYTIYHILKNQTGSSVIIWIIAVLLLSFLGILAYWIFGRKGIYNKEL